MSNALIEKLANYVGSPFMGDYGFTTFGSFAKVVSMISLQEYDASKSSTSPDLKLVIRSGNHSLLDVSP